MDMVIGLWLVSLLGFVLVCRFSFFFPSSFDSGCDLCRFFDASGGDTKFEYLRVGCFGAARCNAVYGLYVPYHTYISLRTYICNCLICEGLDCPVLVCAFRSRVVSWINALPLSCADAELSFVSEFVGVVIVLRTRSRGNFGENNSSLPWDFLHFNCLATLVCVWRVV